MQCLIRLVSCLRHTLHQRNLYSTQHVYDCNTKITALFRAGNIEAARQLFDKMPTRDIVTWNALLTGYWQNGFFPESKKVFESMPERNVVSWNSMVAGCIENDMIDEGFQYFGMIPKKNVASWNAMISGFVKYGKVEEAIRLFRKMPYRNVVSFTSMLDGYLQKGMVGEARDLFDQIPQKNSVTWTVMISGYVENAMFLEARDLFEQMPNKSIVATTAMVTGYCKEGKMEDARVLFDQLSQKDHVAWNALITGYTQNGNGEDALKLFSEMFRLGVQPDKATFVSILTACSFLTSLKEGRQTHSLAVKSGFGLNLSVCNALLSMYSKCGGVVDSKLAFTEICSPDVVSWNTIIAGFAQHGLYEKTCALFNEMRANGFAPDGITFLCMLSACGHSGKINDSMAWFESMVKEYGISPRSEHYACLVDILCRKGQLEKAYEIILEMPIGGDCGIWGALLAACHVYLNAELGELAAKKILELDPHNSGAYVMLSNIYARCGMWKEVAKVRCSMKEQGVKKQSAYSWIELGDEVHIFVGWGVSHPEIDKILSNLKQFSFHLKTAEDVADLLSEVTCFG
ncbi:pentatricopeptide repeat-containing protein At4g02750 [Beta vulgaris subsp. vulgaris]|uniref:pentatricopeptide repeat-containing protein At4g02750 n=1 Tax=Beta vulgaris subsp. vulgaris TaxID=3555 RepID=UPI002036D220|nr:pentatricopeptide repeat-containing protein At4g02750 [Beta vulgaris subsp. vulgaris]